MSLAGSLQRTALALALSAPCALAGSVRIVDPGGQRNFPDIQSAVDAAVEGDVLLVGPGVHSGFTLDGKGLAIFAVPGTAGISGPSGSVTIRNVASRVVLSGIGVGPGCDQALTVADCSGVVSIENCGFTGSSATTPTGCSGRVGGTITNCDSVVLSGCDFSGGRGLYGVGGVDGFPGFAGLLVSNSTVAAYDGYFHGGEGGPTSGVSGGDGGPGLSAVSSQIFAARCTFVGGVGGGGISSSYPAMWCGIGGAGLELDAGSRAHLLQNSAAGGPSGANCQPPGSSAPYSGAGAFEFLPGTARVFDLATITADRIPWTLAVAGVAGDQVFLHRSLDPVFQYEPALSGVCTAQLPPFATVAPAGILPGSEPIAFQVRQRLLPDDVPARVYWLQGRVIESGGASVLGSPMHALSLNWSAPPDCNGNGIQDYFEVLFNLTPDADHDLVPDDCF